MIKTFKEYQASAVGMRVSLQRFLVEHPDLPEDVIELMGIIEDSRLPHYRFRKAYFKDRQRSAFYSR